MSVEQPIGLGVKFKPRGPGKVLRWEKQAKELEWKPSPLSQPTCWPNSALISHCSIVTIVTQTHVKCRHRCQNAQTNYVCKRATTQKTFAH